MIKTGRKNPRLNMKILKLKSDWSFQEGAQLEKKIEFRRI